MKSIAYDAVYNQIMAQMEKGDIPWKKSWKESLPYNGKSGHRYNGINFFILSLAGYADPRWYTYKQATELGGTVKKGEKSRQIVYWNFLTKEVDGKKKSIPLLKYFNVFNHQQIDGLKEEEKKVIELLDAEKIIEAYKDKPEIKHGFNYAAYQKASDLVKMPNKDMFDEVSEYYSTLFHELGHSTGHEKRLNRKSLTETELFGSETYSEEELIAEYLSAFLCAEAGIDNTIENSAAYIKGWMKCFKDNPEMIVHAASKAQKAADYILGRNAVPDPA